MVGCFQLRHTSVLGCTLVAVVLPALYPTTAVAQGVTTDRVSISSCGMEGNAESHNPSISPDGRYVAFHSEASNLVPDDTNGASDVFVHDRRTGQTTRVSVSSDGTQGNDFSATPAISANVRYVAFSSLASNLVPGDTNGTYDVFVHDRQTGQIVRVSVASDGTQGYGFSGAAISISDDGRYVSFGSLASNLVANDTNGFSDVFVHARETGETSRVSVASDSAQGNGTSQTHTSISADGRFVAFYGDDSNLVPDDTNGIYDVFVHDRQTGNTARVSVASNGTQGNGSSSDPIISADGRYVAFQSTASNLVPGDTNGWSDIFVHDRDTAQTVRVSVASDGTQGDAESHFPSVSPEGRYVSFVSYASNLVPGDTNGLYDFFVHDRLMGETSRISITSDGAEANNHSYSHSSISTDSLHIVFESSASNLVSGDTNGVIDVFVRGELVLIDDCNHNLVPDACDILEGTAPDINNNGVLDACSDVPTVSQWGLLVMAILLATTGTIVFRRRHPRGATLR